MMTLRNMTSGPRTALFAALGAALLSGACTGAQAATDSAAPAVRVSLRGLDLSSAAGQNLLHTRLSNAARKVCVVEDIRNLATVAAGSACERSAIARAVVSVHGAHLAAREAAASRRG